MYPFSYKSWTIAFAIKNFFLKSTTFSNFSSPQIECKIQEIHNFLFLLSSLLYLSATLPSLARIYTKFSNNIHVQKLVQTTNTCEKLDAISMHKNSQIEEGHVLVETFCVCSKLLCGRHSMPSASKMICTSQTCKCLCASSKPITSLFDCSGPKMTRKKKTITLCIQDVYYDKAKSS